MPETTLIVVLPHDFRARYLELPPTHGWGMYHCLVSFGRGLGTWAKLVGLGNTDTVLGINGSERGEARKGHLYQLWQGGRSEGWFA